MATSTRDFPEKASTGEKGSANLPKVIRDFIALAEHSHWKAETSSTRDGRRHALTLSGAQDMVFHMTWAKSASGWKLEGKPWFTSWHHPEKREADTHGVTWWVRSNPMDPDAPLYRFGDRVKYVANGDPHFPVHLGTITSGPMDGDNRDALYVVWDRGQGNARRAYVHSIKHASAKDIEQPATGVALHHRVERDAEFTPPVHSARAERTIQRGKVVGWESPFGRAVIQWDGAPELEKCPRGEYRPADPAYVAACRRRGHPAIGDRVEKNVFGEIIGGTVIHDSCHRQLAPRRANAAPFVYVLWDGDADPSLVSGHDIYPQGGATIMGKYARLRRSGIAHGEAHEKASVVWRQ